MRNAMLKLSAAAMIAVVAIYLGLSGGFARSSGMMGGTGPTHPPPPKMSGSTAQ